MSLSLSAAAAAAAAGTILCVPHVSPWLLTIALLCERDPPSDGSENAADSLTRNVKSAEASHIKIAGVPCQHSCGGARPGRPAAAGAR